MQADPLLPPLRVVQLALRGCQGPDLGADPVVTAYVQTTVMRGIMNGHTMSTTQLSPPLLQQHMDPQVRSLDSFAGFAAS